MDQNQIALEKYGMLYRSLSAWGKQVVDQELLEFSQPKVNAPHNVSLDNISPGLVHENDRLSAHNTSLVQENAELWQENADLRTELAELRSQIK